MQGGGSLVALHNTLCLATFVRVLAFGDHEHRSKSAIRSIRMIAT